MGQEPRDGKGRVAIPVLSDPLSWNFMYCHPFQLEDGNRLDVRDLDMIPGDLPGGSQEWGRK